MSAKDLNNFEVVCIEHEDACDIKLPKSARWFSGKADVSSSPFVKLRA